MSDQQANTLAPKVNSTSLNRAEYANHLRARSGPISYEEAEALATRVDMESTPICGKADPIDASQRVVGVGWRVCIAPRDHLLPHVDAYGNTWKTEGDDPSVVFEHPITGETVQIGDRTVADRCTEMNVFKHDEQCVREAGHADPVHRDRRGVVWGSPPDPMRATDRYRCTAAVPSDVVEESLEDAAVMANARRCFRPISHVAVGTPHQNSRGDLWPSVVATPAPPLPTDGAEDADEDAARIEVGVGRALMARVFMLEEALTQERASAQVMGKRLDDENAKLIEANGRVMELERKLEQADQTVTRLVADLRLAQDVETKLRKYIKETRPDAPDPTPGRTGAWLQEVVRIHQDAVGRDYPAWGTTDQQMLILGLVGQAGKLAALSNKEHRRALVTTRPMGPMIKAEDIADVEVFLHLLAYAMGYHVDGAVESRLPSLRRRFGPTQPGPDA